MSSITILPQRGPDADADRRSSPSVAVLHATQFEVVSASTELYLKELDGEAPPTPSIVAGTLVHRTNAWLRAENVARDKNNQFRLLQDLTFYQVASILIKVHRARRIAPIGLEPDKEKPMLGFYVPETGLYETSETLIKSLARQYNKGMTGRELKEVIGVLRGEAPWIQCTSNTDLVALKNGIFNYKTKELLEFHPDFVFLVKTPVDFNPNAGSPIITMPNGQSWEIEGWMRSLSDDREVVHLLWQIVGALVRHKVKWGKSAFFYSQEGNNGKGTLLQLLRNLSGKWVSMALNELSEEYKLGSAFDANAILTDENPVGAYISNFVAFKALITQDALSVNRKYRDPVSFQFLGFMVQCLNDLPRTKDKSNSAYRRQLFIPFEKWFGGDGVEMTAIKDEYLHRQDVLEYVLKKVLVDMPDYYKLSEPAVCKALLDEHKVNNDPVREFWDEVRDKPVLNMLPVEFLYDLYSSWSDRTNPSGSKVKQRPFMAQIDSFAKDSDIWMREHDARGDTKRYDASIINGQLEPLIVEYGLTRWGDLAFFPSNRDRSRVAAPMNKLRGLVRRPQVAAAPQLGATADATSAAAVIAAAEATVATAAGETPEQELIRLRAAQAQRDAGAAQLQTETQPRVF